MHLFETNVTDVAVKGAPDRYNVTVPFHMRDDCKSY